MKQRLVNGDGLNFKDYLKLWNHPVCFRSVGKWFLFSTLKTLIIVIPFIMIMSLLALLAHSVPENPADMLRFFAGIIAFALVFFWIISFYNSFILPDIFEKRIKSFLDNYIPSAVDINKEELDVWTFKWKDTPLAITYKQREQYDRWENHGTRLKKTTIKYFMVSDAFSYDDTLDSMEDTGTEVPLSEGITIGTTPFENYLVFRFPEKYQKEDVIKALQKLIEV